jgi:cysteine desulfurase
LIYLDNAATTRVSAETARFVAGYMTDSYFNTGASYPPAAAVKRDVAQGRAFIARFAGASPEELYFTGSATEANNWALRGTPRRRNGAIVISAGEHSSVYNTAKSLGSVFEIRIAPLRRNGTVDPAALVGLVDGDTALVSVIHVGNETGAVNDIAALCRAVKAKNGGCLFHSDGVQALGKIPVDLHAAGADMYTVSGHKVNAPKGIAALYIRAGLNLNPLITGGGQERGGRGGTENVPGIMGLYHALRSKSDLSARLAERRRQADILRRILSEGGVNASFNGGGADEGAGADGGGGQSPYITSVSIPGVRAETLGLLTAERGVIIGRGSACAAAERGNRVLTAMGVSRRNIEGNIRISLSDGTTDGEIETAAKIIVEQAHALIARLRRGAE